MPKTIASIYFDEVRATRALYGGYYRIPAVPKGGDPFLLTIPDMIQRSQEPSQDGRSKYLRRDVIEAKDIAADILREWTRETIGMTPQCRPGIWVVRDEMPLLEDNGIPKFDADNRAMWRPATEEEKATMWAEDLAAAREANANWADYLITTGDVLAEDPKQWIMIGTLRKTAARYFGKERAWLQELKDSDIKHCPFCTKAIALNAVKCQHCQEVVDVKKYAEMRREQTEAIEAAAGPVRPPVQPKQAARA